MHHLHIGRLFSAAFAAALGLLARPELARACAVCFGGEESDWPSAFLAGTAVMLVLPPAILLGAGIAIYRATKRQEARIAERDALLAGETAPVPRHLQSV